MALPTAEGLQIEVLALPEEGHFVVLGTAGSGKTTLAILRAVYLARLHEEKVLLVTFNKALVTYLQSISEGELRNVDVVNYHRFARGYLNSRGLMGRNDIVPAYHRTKWTKTELIEKAIKTIIEKMPYENSLEKPLEVFVEEINWIQKTGISDLDTYLQAEVLGIGETRISKDERPIFFRVFEKYHEIRRDYNYKYDLEDLACFVRDELDKDVTERKYKHIIIDEGQDLSPTMLQSLIKAIPTNGSLTYFGDVAQQIYGGRVSWRQAGFISPKIWIFKQNYRNTQEIAKLALAISSSPLFKEDADLVEPQSPKASGPLPALIRYKEEQNEIKSLISQVKHFSQNETVAVLVRDRETVSQLLNHFRLNGMNPKELYGEMNSWNSSPGIYVGTFHSAKGLEFDIVFIPFCNKQNLPSQNKIISLESEDEAKSEEIKLLYVGVTRAKRGLIITYSGEVSELLPDNNKLYQEFDR